MFFIEIKNASLKYLILVFIFLRGSESGGEKRKIQT